MNHALIDLYLSETDLPLTMIDNLWDDHGLCVSYNDDQVLDSSFLSETFYHR